MKKKTLSALKVLIEIIVMHPEGITLDSIVTKFNTARKHGISPRRAGQILPRIAIRNNDLYYPLPHPHFKCHACGYIVRSRRYWLSPGMIRQCTKCRARYWLDEMNFNSIRSGQHTTVYHTIKRHGGETTTRSIADDIGTMSIPEVRQRLMELRSNNRVRSRKTAYNKPLLWKIATD